MGQGITLFPVTQFPGRKDKLQVIGQVSLGGYGTGQQQLMQFSTPEQQAQYNAALEVVQPFKIGDDKYDLNAAVKSGVSTDYLNLLFDKDTILQAQVHQDALKALEPYKASGQDNQYDLAKAIQDNVSVEHLNLLFGKDTVSQVSSSLASQAQVATGTAIPTPDPVLAAKATEALQDAQTAAKAVTLTTGQRYDSQSGRFYTGEVVEAGGAVSVLSKIATAVGLAQTIEQRNQALSLYKDLFSKVPIDAYTGGNALALNFAPYMSKLAQKSEAVKAEERGIAKAQQDAADVALAATYKASPDVEAIVAKYKATLSTPDAFGVADAAIIAKYYEEQLARTQSKESATAAVLASARTLPGLRANRPMTVEEIVRLTGVSQTGAQKYLDSELGAGTTLNSFVEGMTKAGGLPDPQKIMQLSEKKASFPLEEAEDIALGLAATGRTYEQYERDVKWVASGYPGEPPWYFAQHLPGLGGTQSLQEYQAMTGQPITPPEGKTVKDYIPETLLATASPSLVVQMLQEKGAPLETQLAYWVGQGKSVNDIKPTSKVGETLFPAIVLAGGDASDIVKKAQQDMGQALFDTTLKEALDRGKSQFDAMVKADKSLAGSLFAGMDAKGIIYYPPDAVSQLRKDSPDLYNILVTGDIVAFQKAQAAQVNSFLSSLQQNFPKIYESYKNGSITLSQASDAVIEQYNADREQFEQGLEKGNPELYKIYKEQGYEAYLEAEQKSYDEATDKLSGYVVSSSISPGGEVTREYDWTGIIKGIRDGKVNKGDAELLFGDKKVADGLAGYDTSITPPQDFLSDEQYQKLNLFKPLGEDAIRQVYGDKVVDEAKAMAKYQGIKWTGDWIYDKELATWVRPTKLSELIKQGDIRAKWGVGTWAEAEAAESYRQLMDRKVTDLSPDDFNTLIGVPFARLEAQVAQIKAPKLTPRYQETPWADKVLQGIAGGVGTTALSSVLFWQTLAGLAGMATKHPITGAGATTLVVLKGMVDWTKDTAVNVVKDPAYGIPYAILTLGPMAYGTGKFALRMGARIITWVHPKGVPFSLIGKEFSMGRVPAGVEGLLKADIGRAVGKAVKEATKPGEKLSGEVTVGGVTVRYLKTPYEAVVGDSLFHGTGDISFVDTKGLYKGLKPKIGEKIVAGLRDIDAPIVRRLNLADVESVPKSIASKLQAIMKKYTARYYGSIVEWLRLKKAAHPGDIDVAVPKKYRMAALHDIQTLLKEKGVPYQSVTHGLEILKGDKWTKLLDLDSVEHHIRWYPEGYKSLPAEYVKGVYVERLGEQITRRGSNLIETGAEGRVKDLPKFKQDVEALAKEKPQYKELLDRFTEDVEMFIKAKGTGEPGIYFSPYAAEFFAVGENPGLVLLLTDTSKIKGVPSEVLAQASQSDWFIRQVEKGLYEPSKSWKGSFETEVVASPRTEFKVPKPTADFVTRMLAGKSADLFTYSSRQERFLPIRVIADKGVLPEPPTAAQLYGVKLHTLAVSLENFIEAVKHPGRTLKDIVHGRPGPKGVREMEVVGVDIRRANGIDAIAARIKAEARLKASQLSAKAGASSRTPKEVVPPPEDFNNVPKLLQSLPKLKKGTVRVIHGGSAQTLAKIQDTGLNFYDGLDDTASVVKTIPTKADIEFIERYATGRSQRNAVSIFDIPESEYKKFIGEIKLTESERASMARQAIKDLELAERKGEYTSDTYVDAYEGNFETIAGELFPNKTKLTKAEIDLVGEKAIEVTQKELLIGTIPKDYLIAQAKIAKGKLKLVELPEAFKRVFERELEEVYKRENKRLLDKYRSQVEKEYRTELGRERFEDIYRYELERDFRTLARMQQFARNLAPALSRAREEMRREGVRPERMAERGRAAPPERVRPTITARREVPTVPRARERPTERVVRSERITRPQRERERLREREQTRRRTTERQDIRERTGTRETVLRERTTTTLTRKERERIRKGENETKLSQAKRQDFAGAIAWRQGALGKPPKDVWYAVKAPYASQDDVGVFIGEPPPNAQIIKGGAKSAYRSIQTITGKAPETLKIDLGFQDIIISGPHRKPGAPGTIRFKQDIGQRTTGDITITSTGRGKPRVIKGVAEETVIVNPLGSSKMPAEVAAAIGSYNAKVTPEGKIKLKVRRL